MEIGQNGFIKKKRLHSNQPMLGKYMQITTPFILAEYSHFLIINSNVIHICDSIQTLIYKMC